MFPFASLRRFPDVEAPNLRAWDVTDELLVRSALERDEAVVVIGDNYGAITLALTSAGREVRVYQDLITGRRALANNAEALGVRGYKASELGPDLLRGATLVLLQLPKALAELEEYADAVARWAPEATLIAGGRVKHMILAQNTVLSRFFTDVQPQRAERKSRLIVASRATPVGPETPFPISRRQGEIEIWAYGGTFSGALLDIGTRTLIEALARAEGMGHDPESVVDLGCGSGALAMTWAKSHPASRVIATDRSMSAVRSAEATVLANNVDDRVRVTFDDAGSATPSASADLVLLNPPFHLGTAVHEGAATRLFDASARILRSGGELWTVFNSHLGHRRVLERLVGPTEQVSRNPKFTVTRTVRR